MDLRAALPVLLPKAIAWAEARAREAAASGRGLTPAELDVARAVGVAHPEAVRIALLDALPVPDEPMLRAAATETGLLGPGMVGLTLGHAILLCKGHDSPRLLRHELRHVHQAEEAGSIAAFLRAYLQQAFELGWANSTFEKDARAHERAGEAERS